MLNLMRCEVIKLRKSQSFKVIFGIICIYGMLMTLTNVMQLSPDNVDNGFNAFLFALAEESTLIIIMGAVMAGIFICADFENRTLQSAVSCGYSRITVLISKALIYFLALSIVMIPYPIIICVGMSIKSGFGVTFSLGIVFKLFASLISVMLINIVALSVCVLAAFLIRKSGAVIGSCIGILAVINIITGVLSRISVELQAVLGCFPSVSGLGRKILNINAGIFDFIPAILISLLFTIIILAIAGSVFKRTELK